MSKPGGKVTQIGYALCQKVGQKCNLKKSSGRPILCYNSDMRDNTTILAREPKINAKTLCNGQG